MWKLYQRASSTPWPPFLLRRIFDLGGRKKGNWGTPLILRRVYDQALGIRLGRTAPLHTQD